MNHINLRNLHCLLNCEYIGFLTTLEFKLKFKLERGHFNNINNKENFIAAIPNTSVLQLSQLLQDSLTNHILNNRRSFSTYFRIVKNIWEAKSRYILNEIIRPAGEESIRGNIFEVLQEATLHLETLLHSWKSRKVFNSQVPVQEIISNWEPNFPAGPPTETD